MPIKTVKGVIKNDEKFLVLLRSANSKFFRNLWDFPGGKLEEGEEKTAGLKREVLEETNLAITVNLPAICEYVATENSMSMDFTIYGVEIIGGEIKIDNDHQEYRWVTKDELAELPAMPYMKSFLATQ